MSVSQISVFLENKSGALANLTSTLADNNINIKAMSVAETSEFGIVRMIVDDVYEATTILKDTGFIAKFNRVIGVTIADEPGSLNEVINILSNMGVDVEYMYAFLGGEKADHANIILRVQELDAAENALRNAGLELLDEE